MTAPITGMYCDRCGARHEFERARPGGVARLRELTRGVRGYVLNEAPTFGDAMTDAWARLEEDGALEQYAEVHETFSFCLDCRGYVCHECWNAAAGRCLTCVPPPGMESEAEAAIAARLDLLTGWAPGDTPEALSAEAPAGAALAPVDATSVTTQPIAADVVAPEVPAAAVAAPEASVAVEPPEVAAPGTPVSATAVVGTTDAPLDIEPSEPGVETVDAAERLARMGMAPADVAAGAETVVAAGAETVVAGTGAADAGTEAPGPDALARVDPAAADGPPLPADPRPVRAAAVEAETSATARASASRSRRGRSAARGVAPEASDEDADVIAAALAAGIILPPSPQQRPGAQPDSRQGVEVEVPSEPLGEVVQPDGGVTALAAGRLDARPDAALPAIEHVDTPADLQPAAEPDPVTASADAEVLATPPAIVGAIAVGTVGADAVRSTAETGAEAAAPIVEPTWPSGLAPSAPATPETVAGATPEMVAQEVVPSEMAAEPVAGPETVAPERDLADQQPVAVPPARDPVTATGPAAAPAGQAMPPAGSTTPGRPRGRDRRRAAPPPRRIPSPVHCRHCGLQVPAVARFCRRCGGRQMEEATVVG